MRKKLIEVALPLEAINRESAREKSIRHGHPSTLHLWWARRPLAACRAVLFASIVDDPSSQPGQFPTEEAQESERRRLFRIIEELVKWENSNNDEVLASARAEIAKATGGDPPPVLDPFCGGGSIPLEAQRLGLPAHGTDLNPVAVLITKALVEIPPRFAARPPVHPEARETIGGDLGWRGTHGLAEDIRYYGRWMLEETNRRIGDLYPRAKLSDGREAVVIAWLWARTVGCPNPACGAEMPLVRSFALSTKKGREWHVELLLDRDARTYKFDVRPGAPTRAGTVDRRGARCVICDTAVPFDHVRVEGRARRLGTRLMAIIGEGDRERVYLPPDEEHERLAASIRGPVDAPETDLPEHALGFRVQAYGMTKHRDLFTPRQLMALTTFSDLISDVGARVTADGGDTDYAKAVMTYLAFALDRTASLNSALCWWNQEGFIAQTFARSTMSMIWDFAECQILGEFTGGWNGSIDWIARVLAELPASGTGRACSADATSTDATGMMLATDPPYYDNVPYADLSDFFYVWLRRSLRTQYPELFDTLLTPKADELIADPHRFRGGRKAARGFFEHGITRFFEHARASADPTYPLTLFYAFKQAETSNGATASTGWETMLSGLIGAGFVVTGTWPVRTERFGGLRELSRNALASSIVLVCRPRPADATAATRREFLSALSAELPPALTRLQHGNIAPVDLAQAAIGPGMAIFSRYVKVVEADGSQMSVRAALALINQALDEVLSAQEGDYDADTRFAVIWFEQRGSSYGPYGEADVLARAKNTSVAGLVTAGVLTSVAGRVRLLSSEELPEDWDPSTDRRLTTWEATQHLTRRLTVDGESGAANLLRRLGTEYGERAKELAYRLYVISERKGWAPEALSYNALVVAWPEISQLSEGDGNDAGEQQALRI